MNRNLRHILPFLSLAVALFVGTWLVVPHDVCLTKLLVSQGCVCLPASYANIDCNCCQQGIAGETSGCGDNYNQLTEHGGAEKNQRSGCFSISSNFSKVTGPERAPEAAKLINLVAVLPLLPILADCNGLTFFRGVIDHHGLTQTAIYRNNCVYLI